MVIAVVSAVWVTASAALALVVWWGILQADEQSTFSDYIALLPTELTSVDVLSTRYTQPSH